MLRLSIHASRLDAATRYNRVGWLDIGYERLAPVADYKVLLAQSGLGGGTPRTLVKYPRWSASLWDLVSRAIALCLSEDDPPREVVPEITPGKHRAFCSSLSALVEHYPGGDAQRRHTLATADIQQKGRRCHYVACFEEHTMSPVTTDVFLFAPGRLRPTELLLHAALHRLYGKAVLGPRPALCVPDAISHAGTRFVAVHRLVEPARTGFLRWLTTNSEPPIEHPGAPLGIAPESLYVTFLSEAV